MNNVGSTHRFRHGHSPAEQRSPAYSSWGCMIQRCHNPEHAQYAAYGGIGIRVCAQWREAGGFRNFIAYIGPRPDGQYSIDRIDGTKGYEPGNVRWATRYEQSRNMKSNVWVEIDGERFIVKDAAKKYGINDKTLRHRLKKMSAIDALTKPVACIFGRTREGTKNVL